VLVRRITSNLLSPQEVTPDEEILCRNVRKLCAALLRRHPVERRLDSTQLGDLLPVACR